MEPPAADIANDEKTGATLSQGAGGRDAHPLFETKEAALAAFGDVRLHHKGGVYRALFAAVGVNDLAAGQRVALRMPTADVVEAAELFAKMCAAWSAGTVTRDLNVEGHAAVLLAHLEIEFPADAHVVVRATVTDDVGKGVPLMVYEHLHPHAHEYYARPLEMFEGNLPDEGPLPGKARFERMHGVG